MCETPHASQTPRQTALENKRSGYRLSLCPFPRPGGKVSPEPLVPPMGKENPGETASTCTLLCGSLYWNPYFIGTPWGLQRNLWGSTTRNLTVMKKWGGLRTSNTQILAGQLHTCITQVIIPNSGFAHLQN